METSTIWSSEPSPLRWRRLFLTVLESVFRYCCCCFLVLARFFFPSLTRTSGHEMDQPRLPKLKSSRGEKSGEDFYGLFKDSIGKLIVIDMGIHFLIANVGVEFTVQQFTTGAIEFRIPERASLNIHDRTTAQWHDQRYRPACAV